MHDPVATASIFGEIYRVEPAVLLAISDVESSGRTDKFHFDVDGFNRAEDWQEVFDRHYDKLPNLTDVGHHGRNFSRAKKIHPDHAHNCVIFGQYQLHGWNYFRLGYDDAKSMLTSWTDPHEQTKGFCLWMQFANPVYPLLRGKRAPATSVGPVLAAARKAGSGNVDPYCKLARTSVHREKYKKAFSQKLALRKDQLALLPGFQKRGKHRGTRGYFKLSNHAFVTRDLRGKPAPREDKYCKLKATSVLAETTKEIIEGFFTV